MGAGLERSAERSVADAKPNKTLHTKPRSSDDELKELVVIYLFGRPGELAGSSLFFL